MAAATIAPRFIPSTPAPRVRVIALRPGDYARALVN